jgi:hypothetical protein
MERFRSRFGRRRSGPVTPQPQPSLQSLSVHAVKDVVKVEIVLTQGMGFTLTLSPEGAEQFAEGLKMGATKARGEPQ